MKDGSEGQPEEGHVRRSRFIWVFVIGLLALFAVAVAREQLFDLADERHFDPAPLPRPKLNAPFIKSADEVVDAMIELAEISDRDLVYDLGCGDGKIVISAAVQRGCRGIGFDIEPARIQEATENAKLHQVEHLVTFQQADVFKVDLHDADVIVMYLLPWMVRDLVPQFEKCRPGTRIVSHDWKIEGIEATKTIEVPTDPNVHWVHLYVTPLKKLPPEPARNRGTATDSAVKANDD